MLLTGAQTAPAEDLTSALHAVESALAALGESVEITTEPHLTAPKLQQLLRQGFQVWHFVGQSGVDAGGASGQLLFEDGHGGAKPVSTGQLNILLNRSGLRLVVLGTSGGWLATEPFHRLALALTRAQVPAVVATQFTSPGEVTQAFVNEFYRSLTENFPIDACVTEGRKAIMSEVGLERADWALPVVYTRAPDGTLFDLPASSVPDIPARIVSPSAIGGRGAEVAVNSQDGTLLYPHRLVMIERIAQAPRPPPPPRSFLGATRN